MRRAPTVEMGDRAHYSLAAQPRNSNVRHASQSTW